MAPCVKWSENFPGLTRDLRNLMNAKYKQVENYTKAHLKLLKTVRKKKP
jgi:hypothetical protein